VVASTEEDPAVTLQKSIESLHEQLSSLKAAASAAASALKVIEKQAARAVKKADRRRKRRTEVVEGAVPKPNIFTKPVKVSDELLAFLGKPKGTDISRSSVTKEVIAYAKAHNLMTKQSIAADAAMRKLLRLSDTDALTIMNLQKFLCPHYIKAEPVAV
jgi:chromatin remodeling complex protein RSC6